MNQVGNHLSFWTIRFELQKNHHSNILIYFPNNQIIQGIANMGVRPTIGGNSPVLEIHLFEFDKDIYSERLIVKFIKKIRDEKKFDNLDMLKLQIQEDILIAKNILHDSHDT